MDRDQKGYRAADSATTPQGGTITQEQGQQALEHLGGLMQWADRQGPDFFTRPADEWTAARHYWNNLPEGVRPQLAGSSR